MAGWESARAGRGHAGASDASLLLERVEELAGRSPTVGELRMHGVELIATRSWRAQGRAVPAQLRDEERAAAMKAMAAQVVLKRARSAYDGTLVLMKGPEIASHYPDSALRPYRDLDLLVDEAAAAQKALLAAGFMEVGDPAKYEGVHHLRPVAWPDLPLPIELHHELNHATWLRPPRTAELLPFTRPSATGVPGLLAPIPAVHALLLAVHSWTHEPLRRLLDLVDIAFVLDDDDRQLAEALARRWHLERIWHTTLDAVDALLLGHGHALTVRVWGRHLVTVRERTVLETHIARWAGPAYGLSRTRALAIGAATAGFAAAAGPKGDERWADAARRTWVALANALIARSRHAEIKERRRG